MLTETNDSAKILYFCDSDATANSDLTAGNTELTAARSNSGLTTADTNSELTAANTIPKLTAANTNSELTAANTTPELKAVNSNSELIAANIEDLEDSSGEEEEGSLTGRIVVVEPSGIYLLNFFCSYFFNSLHLLTILSAENLIFVMKMKEEIIMI